METKLRRGAVSGILVALLIVCAQPFYPIKGLIPELSSFLVTVPIFLGGLIYSHKLSPLGEGAFVLAYFTVIGALVGVAFEKKRIWGWFLLIAVAVNHYVIYEQFRMQIGEVVDALLNIVF